MIPSPADDPVSTAPAGTRWIGGAIMTVVALGVIFVGAMIWNSRRLPEPPMASLPRDSVPAASVVPNAQAIAAQRRLDSLASAALAVGSAAAAQNGGVATQPVDTTSVAAAAPPVSAPVPNVESQTLPGAGAAAPSTGGLASRFDSLADSLEHGLHNYHDRRVDFGQKRLSCTELAYGYRAADEALVSLARLAGDARSLDAQRAARYNQLRAGMDTVNNDFDASKCKRI
jgi:hypothetical protein